MLVKACGEVSGCLPNIAGTTARTSDMLHQITTEMIRDLGFSRRDSSFQFPGSENNRDMSDIVQMSSKRVTHSASVLQSEHC